MVHRRTPRALFWACPLLLALPAWAQPANDLCTNAPSLSLGTPVAGTTAGAGKELFNTCGDDAADVFYRFVATAAGAYDFTVTGQPSADGLTLGLMGGDCAFDFTFERTCATGSAFGPATATVQLPAGEVVLVRVGSVASGQAFSVSVQAAPPPSNDECANAVPVLPRTLATSSTVAATTTVELPVGLECAPSQSNLSSGADVFFSYTPPSTGYYDVIVCEADFNTVVTVHTACPVSAANTIGCNDEAGPGQCPSPRGQSFLAGVPMTGGVTYYVRVAGVAVFNPRNGVLSPPDRGTIGLSIVEGVPAVPPPNDECAAAQTITVGQTLSGTTLYATGQAGPCDDGGDLYDAWYAFTAPGPGRRLYDFSINNEAFDGQGTIVVYPTCGGTPIVCNAFGGFASQQGMTSTVALNAGQSVVVRVAGRLGVRGPFTFSAADRGAAAVNTGCATAQAVELNVPVTADTATAPSSGSSPCGFQDFYALWYSFTATEAGYYRFGTSFETDPEQQFGTSLALYTACGTPLTCELFDPDSLAPAAAISIHVSAGQTIYARVAYLAAVRRPVGFEVFGPLLPPPPVENDTCATAFPVTQIPFAASVDATLATRDQDVCFLEPNPLPTYAGVWYSYTPDVDRVFRAYGGSSLGRFMRYTVFTGPCTSPTQAFCHTFDFPYDPGVRMSAGVTYYILVSSLPGLTGTAPGVIPYGNEYFIDFIAPPVPPNDDCATAERITSSSAEFTIDTLGADHEAPAPSCGGFNGLFSNAMWYTFTTATAGTLTVFGDATESFDAYYIPAGALFSGGCSNLTEIACGDPASEPGLLRKDFTITASLEAGRTYHLALGSWLYPIGSDTEITFTYTGQIGTGPTCRADFDGSGAVNVSDIFAFLSAWFSGASPADIDGNGQNQVSDIFAFLSLWFAGC